MTTFSAIGFIHFVNDPVHRKRCHVYPRMKTLGVVGIGVVLHRQDEGDGVIGFEISLLFGYHARHETTRLCCMPSVRS